MTLTQLQPRSLIFLSRLLMLLAALRPTWAEKLRTDGLRVMSRPTQNLRKAATDNIFLTGDKTDDSDRAHGASHPWLTASRRPQSPSSSPSKQPLAYQHVSTDSYGILYAHNDYRKSEKGKMMMKNKWKGMGQSSTILRGKRRWKRKRSSKAKSPKGSRNNMDPPVYRKHRWEMHSMKSPKSHSSRYYSKYKSHGGDFIYAKRKTRAPNYAPPSPTAPPDVPEIIAPTQSPTTNTFAPTICGPNLSIERWWLVDANLGTRLQVLASGDRLSLSSLQDQYDIFEFSVDIDTVPPFVQSVQFTDNFGAGLPLGSLSEGDWIITAQPFCLPNGQGGSGEINILLLTITS